MGDISTRIAVAVEPREELASLLREYDAEMTRSEYRRTSLEPAVEAEFVERYTIHGAALDAEAFSRIAEEAENVTVVLKWDLTQEEMARFEL